MTGSNLQSTEFEKPESTKASKRFTLIARVSDHNSISSLQIFSDSALILYTTQITIILPILAKKNHQIHSLYIQKLKTRTNNSKINLEEVSTIMTGTPSG